MSLTCATCGWYKGIVSPTCGPRVQNFCVHPMNRDHVTGTSMGAYDARRADGVCGPQAHLHTARAIPSGVDERRQ